MDRKVLGGGVVLLVSGLASLLLESRLPSSLGGSDVVGLYLPTVYAAIIFGVVAIAFGVRTRVTKD